MNDTSAKRRHWFRFSLRTLFVLTTFTCLSVGWIINHAKWIEQRNEFIRTHRQGGWMRQIPASGVPPTYFGLLRRASGPVGLRVRESEFAAAKELFPDAEWN